jgi:hypothetical protein
MGDDISTTFTFLAGWEWEKTSTFIKCNIVEISSFKNPPDKRVMIVLTPGLRLTQCAVNFEPKMEPGIGTVEYAGCDVNPWECTINPHVLRPDFNFEQAVDRSKKLHDGTLAKHLQDPSLLENAVKELSKKGPVKAKKAKQKTKGKKQQKQKSTTKKQQKQKPASKNNQKSDKDTNSTSVASNRSRAIVNLDDTDENTATSSSDEGEHVDDDGAVLDTPFIAPSRSYNPPVRRRLERTLRPRNIQASDQEEHTDGEAGKNEEAGAHSDSSGGSTFSCQALSGSDSDYTED